MKLDAYTDHNHNHISPHESTSSIMNKPPLIESEEEEQNLSEIYPKNSSSSTVQTPQPQQQTLPLMPEVDNYSRQQRPGPADLSPLSELPYNLHGQPHPHHEEQLASSFYGLQHQRSPPVYHHHHSAGHTQIMHHQVHNPHVNQHHAAYFPNNNWSPTTGSAVPPPPPMMPSMTHPYYQHHVHQLPPPHLIMPINTATTAAVYQSTLDSRGSLSSYSSSDTFGSSANAIRRAGGGAHGHGGSGSGRRNNRRGSRHGGSGGTPPNRGWYRFDETTTLFQMKGRIIEIAKDRDGSKFIQKRLQVAQPSKLQLVYNESLVGISQLWNDVYGNYILQALLELGTEEMRDGIGKKILGEGDVVFLSMKVYGCRLIQKALETLEKEDVANIVAAVKGKVWLLVHDHNGNHVIQKSITKINEFFQNSQHQEEKEEDDEATMSLLGNSLNIIIDEVTSSIKDLAIHPYGCRVVQRLIEHCSGDRKGAVLDSILDGGLYASLINHEYGNYVIQRVLAYGRPSDKSAVFEIVASNNNVLKLSKQKHSSNVVEMMLTYGNALQRQRIIEEILNCFCVDQNYNSKSAAVAMAEDNYANYVLKTALDILEEGNPQRERLFGMLLSSLDELESSPFAKQVVFRVKAYAQETNNYEP